jgi:hypothetical protein
LFSAFIGERLLLTQGMKDQTPGHAEVSQTYNLVVWAS